MPVSGGKTRGDGGRPAAGERAAQLQVDVIGDRQQRTGRQRRGSAGATGAGGTKPHDGHDETDGGAPVLRVPGGEHLEERAGEGRGRAQLVPRQVPVLSLREQGVGDAPRRGLVGRQREGDGAGHGSVAGAAGQLRLEVLDGAHRRRVHAVEQRQVEGGVVAELDEREQPRQPRGAARADVGALDAARLELAGGERGAAPQPLRRPGASSRNTARLAAATCGRLVQPMSSLWSSSGSSFQKAGALAFSLICPFQRRAAGTVRPAP